MNVIKENQRAQLHTIHKPGFILCYAEPTGPNLAIKFSQNKNRLCFILCKGFENSFYPDISISILSNLLLDWLENIYISNDTKQITPQIKELEKILSVSAQKATEKLEQIKPDETLSSIFQSSFRLKQKEGNEVQFACGCVEQCDTDDSLYNFLIIQVGIYLRLWDYEKAEITIPKINSKDRWTSKKGADNDSINIVINAKSKLTRIMLFTDEYQELLGLNPNQSSTYIEKLVTKQIIEEKPLGGFLEIIPANLIAEFEFLPQEQKDLLFSIINSGKGVENRHFLSLLSGISDFSITPKSKTRLDGVLKDLENRQFIDNYTGKIVRIAPKITAKIQKKLDGEINSFKSRIAERALRTLKEPEFLIYALLNLGYVKTQSFYQDSCIVTQTKDRFLDIAFHKMKSLYRSWYDKNTVTSYSSIVQLLHNIAFCFDETEILEKTTTLLDSIDSSALIESRKYFQPVLSANEFTKIDNRPRSEINANHDQIISVRGDRIEVYSFQDKKPYYFKTEIPLSYPLISPDGKIILTRTTKETIESIDIQSGKVITTIKFPDKIQEQIQFLPDSDKFVCRTANNQLYIGSATTGKIAGEYTVENQLVRSIDVDPTTNNLFLLTRKKNENKLISNLIIFKSISFEAVSSYNFPDDMWVRKLVCSKQKDLIYLQTHEKIIVWNIEEKKQVTSYPVVSSNFVLAEKENLIIYINHRTFINVFDKSTNQIVHRFRGHNTDIIFVKLSNDNQYLYTIDIDGFICKWDMNDLPNPEPDHEEEILSITASSENNLICTVGKDQTIRTWSIQDVKQTSMNYVDEKQSLQRDISSVEILKKEKMLIQPMGNHIDLISLSNFQPKFSLCNPTSTGAGVVTYEVSLDHKWLAALYSANHLCVFNLLSGACQGFMISDNRFTCLAWVDNKTIVAGDVNGEIHMIKWKYSENE